MAADGSFEDFRRYRALFSCILYATQSRVLRKLRIACLRKDIQSLLGARDEKGGIHGTKDHGLCTAVRDTVQVISVDSYVCRCILYVKRRPLLAA